jgi:hypothetical protein
MNIKLIIIFSMVGPLLEECPYHGALTLNLISLGTVEDNG